MYRYLQGADIESLANVEVDTPPESLAVLDATTVARRLAEVLGNTLGDTIEEVGSTTVAEVNDEEAVGEHDKEAKVHIDDDTLANTLEEIGSDTLDETLEDTMADTFEYKDDEHDMQPISGLDTLAEMLQEADGYSLALMPADVNCWTHPEPPSEIGNDKLGKRLVEIH